MVKINNNYIEKISLNDLDKLQESDELQIRIRLNNYTNKLAKIGKDDIISTNNDNILFLSHNDVIDVKIENIQGIYRIKNIDNEVFEDTASDVNWMDLIITIRFVRYKIFRFFLKCCILIIYIIRR